MRDKFTFPSAPYFSEDDWSICRRTGDYRPILFEWYKYVGITANLIACIDISSPASKPVNKSHFGVLLGLLNRCSRLMLSNIVLSHKGLHGETTSLIDRCIFESAVKILWLCEQSSGEAFNRYIADGLKTELVLKKEIENRISSRDGQILLIEKRMLQSIERYIKTSGLAEDEIASAKKLQDIRSMLKQLSQDDIAYIAGQKIGSHHIHGTLPSLLTHYIEVGKDGNFHPKDHNAPTHINQYIFISLIVLSATKSFIEWLTHESDMLEPLRMLEAIENEILAINEEIVGDDFIST